MKQLTQAQYESLVGFLKEVCPLDQFNIKEFGEDIQIVAMEYGLIEDKADGHYKLADWIEKL